LVFAECKTPLWFDLCELIPQAVRLRLLPSMVRYVLYGDISAFVIECVLESYLTQSRTCEYGATVKRLHAAVRIVFPYHCMLLACIMY